MRLLSCNLVGGRRWGTAFVGPQFWVWSSWGARQTKRREENGCRHVRFEGRHCTAPATGDRKFQRQVERELERRTGTTLLLPHALLFLFFFSLLLLCVRRRRSSLVVVVVVVVYPSLVGAFSLSLGWLLRGRAKGTHSLSFSSRFFVRSFRAFIHCRRSSHHFAPLPSYRPLPPSPVTNGPVRPSHQKIKSRLHNPYTSQG